MPLLSKRTFFRLAMLALAGLPVLANAGILFSHPEFSVVADGYINITGGSDLSGAENLDADADIRLLGLHENASGLRWGGRITYETSSFGDIETDVGEASLLVQDDRGRIEIGKRQGLPDVLTGFAPNNYTFTSAEYGPATGRNLNPAGGLQTSFLDTAIAGQINSLSSLGFVASLAGNRSEKIIYAAPRTESGFAAGISFASDISDDNRGFKELVQTGLTYDYYWGNNQLHAGGSYTYAKGESHNTGPERGDLNSLNLGVAATLDNTLAIGFSTTYNGDSGQLNNSFKEDTIGWVTSVNYNKGPMTYGGFYQQAYGQGDELVAGKDRLKVFQLGASYRFNIRTRLYTAYYYYRLDNEEQATSDGDVLLVGIRLIL